VSPNRKVIEEASNYPLSIICVGVGDGPFGDMENFDDVIKKSKFDNFNFVNYFKVCEGHVENPDVAFACGSASIRSTFLPSRAIDAERFIAVVVFPTPPF
jgi:hypothetical protein